MDYLSMTQDEVLALPRRERLEASEVRSRHRAAILELELADAPTREDLIVCDMRLGIVDRSEQEHKIHTKDNYATKYERQPDGTLKAIRGDRTTKPVAEASFKQIDMATGTRQDNAMNRYLQSDAPTWEAEVKSKRFAVSQLHDKIRDACVRHSLMGLYEALLDLPLARLQGEDPDAWVDRMEARNELVGKQRAIAYKTRILWSNGKDYRGEDEPHASVGQMIEKWFEKRVELAKAQRELDTQPMLPKRVIDTRKR